jgi:chromosome segregation ATPase
MEAAEGGGGLALFAELREQLSRELIKLADKRVRIEAQLEALPKELKALDVEVEATRRMLELVEATEQQLAGQGQEGADKEVRGGLWQSQFVCL